MDEYRDELQKGAAELDAPQRTVGIRGSGPARYVFAEQGLRAAELYRDTHGWRVECWDQAELICEGVFEKASEGLHAVIEWLDRHKAIDPEIAAG